MRSESLKPKVPGAMAAETVTSGHFVLYHINKDRRVIGLKAVRHGKDHINHYFVPLEPTEGTPITVTYLDCTAEVQDCHKEFTLNLERLEMEKSICVGDIFVNATGTYIKVCETTKGIVSFVYVDLDSGELRRRQERQVSAVYRWTLTCIGVDPRQKSKCPHHEDGTPRAP